MVHLTADELVAYTNDELEIVDPVVVDEPQAMSVQVALALRNASHEPPGRSRPVL